MLYLSEINNDKIGKSFLDSVYSVAGYLNAEELYVSVSLEEPKRNRIIRDLMVFGFERTSRDKYTSNKEIEMLKIEVNQEYDFVDLI